MTKPFTPDEIIKAVGIRLGELRQALAELAREHAALREQVAELRGEMRGYPRDGATSLPALPPRGNGHASRPRHQSARAE